eukprot:GAHX01001318.1.p1 GENE.GAHX01001318.1~~GAHX01001318.1.p1  ORF type:complete len:342 (+),score=63.05 GAHX01001318.1:38-1027(+)
MEELLKHSYLKDYKVKAFIGSFANSEIYYAINTSSKIEVILKFIFSEEPLEWASKEQKALEFKHPNILPILEILHFENHICVVTQYAEYGSCIDILDIFGPEGMADERLVASIIYQLLDGLSYLHYNKTIHRSINTRNILIARKGEVFIKNLSTSGCLVEDGEVIKSRRTIVGIDVYTPPEMLNSDIGYSYSVDVWSVGITALELYFGKPPYCDDNSGNRTFYKLAKGTPPSVDSYKNAKNSPNDLFREFIDICLKKEPDQRVNIEELKRFNFFKDIKSSKEANKYIVDKFKFIEGEIENRLNKRIDDYNKKKDKDQIKQVGRFTVTSI